MRRLAILIGFASFIGTSVGTAQQPWQPSEHIAATDPKPPAEQVKCFQLPPGFEIQLVAAEPEIDKPINIAFDAAGRLWVTCTREYPFPAPPGKKGRDSVRILSDFAPNGRARKVTTFADGLNIPIGVLPTSQGAIVFSIPNIYHMVDTDRDGKADRRDVLFSNYGYADTHGMTGEFMWGFDGWVYACHGFANTSKVKGAGHTGIEMHSGNTYRFKPNGSRIEYFTHGQVNPFGLAWDSLGNLYSCDCHSRPIYQLLRGGWYPSFQKPHDGLGFAPEMMTHHHDSTAIAGIAYYAADNFPPEFRDNIFIGNVTANRINRDRLERQGSTNQAVAMPDLVKSTDPWFRPVDIKLGPDGALYVADFYNRIIGHYEVPLDHPGRDRERGRIWRIVYTGNDSKPAKSPGDLSTADVAELIRLLDHANLSVRMTATNQLVERGEAAAKAIHQVWHNGTAHMKAHGLWALERLGRLDDGLLKNGLEESDTELVYVHALRILAGRATWTPEQRKRAIARLDEAISPLAARTAVEALGNHPQFENIELLLAVRGALSTLKDSHLRHTVRMALRDNLQSPDVWARLGSDLDKGQSAYVADVCPGLRSPESAEFVLRHVERYGESPGNLRRYGHHVARYGAKGTGREFLAAIGKRYTGDLPLQGSIIQAVHRGTQERGGSLSPEEIGWAEDIARSLVSAGAETERLAGVELAADLKLTATQDALRDIVNSAQSGEKLRQKAVSALATINAAGNVVFFSRLLADAGQPAALREQAAHSLAGAGTDEARTELVVALTAAPARLQQSIAQALAGSRTGAEKLLEAVAAGKASARLVQEPGVAQRLRAAKVANLSERLQKLTAGLPPPDQRLAESLAKRRAGFLGAKYDVNLGAKVFEKHCAACHQLNNQGSKIGPQIDGIGSRGLDRLLEDLLDPNRNVDQAFRATTLELKNGQIMTGLLLKQEGAVLVLADQQGKEVRVAEDTVAARVVSQQSPMPPNLVEQISPEDFNHLLAFLLAQQPRK